MIFMFNIRFYLHFIKLYDCKNKHIFPNFQILSDNCANYERFLYFCTYKASVEATTNKRTLNTLKFQIRHSVGLMMTLR